MCSIMLFQINKNKTFLSESGTLMAQQTNVSTSTQANPMESMRVKSTVPCSCTNIESTVIPAKL